MDWNEVWYYFIFDIKYYFKLCTLQDLFKDKK